MTARDSYALLAPFYERFHDQTRLHELRQIVMRETTPCQTLDVGAGTGLMGRYLAHQGYDVTLLDASATMLDKAQEYALQEGLRLNYLQQSMLAHYPLEAELIVASMDVINHLPDLDAVQIFFDRVFQALKDKGRFIFDSLTCQYIQSLIGYQETLPVKGQSLTWTVQHGAHACSLEHHFSDGLKNTVIQERSYSPATLLSKLSKFSSVQRKTLKDRHVFIVTR